MGLLKEPIIKKFFVNKIESSRPDWGDYLLKVADIFSTFDGDDLDREIRSERFAVISGRPIDAPRDVSNYRDEFGAYGPFLGVFHVQLVEGKWKVFLSNSAKHFLCSTEPDVESFCRAQLALFQYPNGIGAVQNRNGTVRVQANALADTVREISNGIKVNPLRLLCRVVVALHELNNVALTDVSISYQSIFMLMNDDRINTTFSPDKHLLVSILDEYDSSSPPAWAVNQLTNFKRNFHILEWTGLFSRTSNGLSVCADNDDRKYSYIKAICEMNINFNEFNSCYNAIDMIDKASAVISSPAWGIYYDAMSLPMQVLSELTSEINEADLILSEAPIGFIPQTNQPFPALRSFQSGQPRAYVPRGIVLDPFETLILREKANCEHARILRMLAALLRLRYDDVYENTFIDLYANIDGQPFIFEVKSNNQGNVLSQIRKAVAQLYEYRYRSGLPQAILCIVLQQKPPQEWVIDYLVNDRNIIVCWLVDDVRLECPSQCHALLGRIGVL